MNLMTQLVKACPFIFLCIKSLTSQNISTFSGSEARPSQNTSTAFSCTSNRLISQNTSSPLVSEVSPSLELISLPQLSSNLEQPLIDYNAAEIVVEGIPVSINRGFLAEKRSFFHEIFERGKGYLENDGKPKYLLSDLLPFAKVGYEAFQFFLSCLYTGELHPPPLEGSTCVDKECGHDACGPAIDFTRRLVNFVDKAYVEDVIPILLAAFYCRSDELVNQCVDRIARSDLDNISIEKELPYELSKRIELSRKESMSDDEQVSEAVVRLHEKAIRRIHRALDRDDIELVGILSRESHVTLDDANCLHYAVAHCDDKARVNLKDSRLGRGVHGQVIKSSEEPDQVVNNALLSLYAQCGCYSEVLKMFDEMPQRNVVSEFFDRRRLFNGMSCEDLATWNAMLTGYAINGRMREVTAMLGLQKMG
ncbi:hypothetical protein GH714_003683 [Hevea brasiliensis]|uniref:Uncharacterized protein n=1 Tax=Hevea brasiliensis TaxID=3981 RepID=A0A6A6MC48_HEVBR|nr:hypothetical protein GH714_003683 [Hevea brasiliensis]